ncbi:hypothetical protein PO909_014622 [Leuciscus waleckii]
MLCCQPTREQLRLLITDCRAHYPSSVAQYIWAGAQWTEDFLTHAKADVKHMFSQRKKVTVTRVELGGHNHRSKRFLGALLGAAAAARTLFNIGMPSVNAHSTTVNSMNLLFTIFQNDFAQTQLITALTTDMLWEVSSSNDSLATGIIPLYMVPLSLVQTVMATATATPTDPLQIHLAYSLGSAIPLYVDPEQREVGFLLNLPISESSQVYRLTDIVNVRFWESNTHIKIRTPDVVAYRDSDTQLYSAPNLHMRTLTKDIHYLCPAEAKLRTQVTETQAEIVGRVLNGSARPDKPDGTRGFGPGSGRKYKQMTRVGSDIGLNLFRSVKKKKNIY